MVYQERRFDPKEHFWTFVGSCTGIGLLSRYRPGATATRRYPVNPPWYKVWQRRYRGLGR